MAQVFDTLGLDPTLPDIVLRIGGKDRQLAFDIAAIVQAEKLTGINLLIDALQGLNFSILRGMLYAALLKDDPDITLQDVDGMITFRNAHMVYNAIEAAWVGSAPDKDNAAPGEAQAQDVSPA